jgi:glycine cleavage system regulatory protein
MTPLVLTVIGQDRPGLVESLSHTISTHGGNWLESRMSSLAGKFAGILLASVPEAHADALLNALRGLESKGLAIVVEKGATGESAMAHDAFRLELVGQDHPGIVRDIAHALASRGISIDELHTETRSASMSGEELFHATAQLHIPQDILPDELRDVLETLADELMVDIQLEAPPAG